MDIYKFFNSKDVAEYLKEINYEFTLPEAAFIVFQSEHRTLEEKCVAWRELIDTIPDCSMEGRRNLRPIESFHQFLRDYMALQEKILKMFREPEGHIYTYEFLNSPYYRGEEYFADADTALAHFARNKEDYLEDGEKRVRFNRRSLHRQPESESTDTIRIEMTMDLEVISVDFINVLSEEEEALAEQFKGMFFMIPTPFKRGDILIDCSLYCRTPGPFVLESISTWDREALLKNGYDPKDPYVMWRDETINSFRKYRDYSDMSYGALYMEKDGEGFPTIVAGNGWTYLNLEYYDKPLEGIDRALRVVSSAMTYDPEYGGPSVGSELLCNAYQLILTEEMCRANRAAIDAAWRSIEM